MFPGCQKMGGRYIQHWPLSMGKPIQPMTWGACGASNKREIVCQMPPRQLNQTICGVTKPDMIRDVTLLWKNELEIIFHLQSESSKFSQLGPAMPLRCFNYQGNANLSTSSFIDFIGPPQNSLETWVFHRLPYFHGHLLYLFLLGMDEKKYREISSARYGNTLALNGRDCSTQRRFQWLAVQKLRGNHGRASGKPT